ncbi:peptidase M23 [Robertmurraya sp. FSL R5-0851]|uniref:peptidase M23 n=1 Tax=Robertmurraya sp. FSL R5-0851 TaxID=2921584 RepID=UPI0030F8B8CD
MATTLRTILFILLFAFITQMQINLDSDKTATRQIKNALELAVHDAALAISPIDMANGRIVFNQDLAIYNLSESLKSNLHLDTGAGYVYTPTSNSFFKNDLYISHLEFIDDTVTRTYPYTYINNDYDIMETVNGPSVIAVLTTESPRWFKGGTTYIRQAAVYEYIK